MISCLMSIPYKLLEKPFTAAPTYIAKNLKKDYRLGDMQYAVRYLDMKRTNQFEPSLTPQT